MTKDEALKLDIPDFIAGAFGVSRGTAYDMMREALAPTSTPCEVQPEQQESDGPIADGWCINFSNGHSGMGVYAHMDEYPEEGAILLCGVPKWAIDTLAQPEQEPVACDCRLQADECNGVTATFHPLQVGASCSTHPCERVYTVPPKAKRPWGKPWVSLTDDEVLDVFKEKNAMKFARNIEAALKEKNT